MANLIRSAKSGSSWTANDLVAYNIRIQHEDIMTFFGPYRGPIPPPAGIEPEFWETLDAAHMLSIDNAQMVHLINLAMHPGPPANENPLESTVDDLSMILLRKLHLLSNVKIACSRQEIPLLICGESRRANPNICLRDRSHNDIILLIQENKRFQVQPAPIHPHAQIIAEAIAAFQYNNHWQQHGAFNAIFHYIPAISFVGTTPNFYKIRVTADLAHHVEHGTFPLQETLVSVYAPFISDMEPGLGNHYMEGMRPLQNRKCVLRAYQAFRSIISQAVTFDLIDEDEDAKEDEGDDEGGGEQGDDGDDGGE